MNSEQLERLRKIAAEFRDLSGWAERLDAAAIEAAIELAESEPATIYLCKVPLLHLEPDQTYVVRVHPSCARCRMLSEAAAAARAKEGGGA